MSNSFARISNRSVATRATLGFISLVAAIFFVIRSWDFRAGWFERIQEGRLATVFFITGIGLLWSADSARPVSGRSSAARRWSRTMFRFGLTILVASTIGHLLLGEAWSFLGILLNPPGLFFVVLGSAMLAIGAIAEATGHSEQPET